ncbi:MAG TPA: cytochrome c oxidase subunit 4 [Thermoleophilia bacterium]|nr:cytochrome c oxidase subunit 4 [Thermoleophilia bacterium]
MRDSGRLFAGIAIFFGLVGVVYWVLADEPAGAAFLIFTGGLGFLIAFYLLFTAKRVEPLPEDDQEGELADAAGQYGFFSPHSWWPLPLGFGAAMIALGLAFVAWWMILLGAALLVFATAGLLFEYYRGEFVRN